ncbi:DUF4232 domain-containing protein [Streptomyces sp. CHD11]|uniref:DUF4232 domain-containing protein n=1 Tax=Streptomyces sp. CHD11 TaxID=2741325 RepID=UPI001BFC8508|nr:DUF4232 domain-containing protein [Streptomyces sp. CHD11]MBT3149773.1 DUF4232 domain-containing protein [Streptomyces sp. CHD11]
MRVNKFAIAILSVVAGLSLTACQNDDDAATAQDGSPAASAPSSSNAGPSSGGSDQGAAKDSAGESPDQVQSATGKCRTDELEVTAQDSTIGGDEDNTVAVTFTNGGGRDCSIAGFAGVDLETNAGTVSAERAGEPASATVLKDGESISFSISYPANDTGGSGARITGLVVTPPNETKSVTLDWPGAASLPVTDGSGSPVRVGPIGSAGQGG